MISSLRLQALADLFFSGFLVSIVLGGPIVFLALGLLRLGGRQSSTTRFALWYSALLAISAALFLGRIPVRVSTSAAAASSHSLITVPDSWAAAGLTVWSLFTVIAFFRMVVGLARLQQLRRGSRAIGLGSLDPILQGTLRELNCDRDVRIHISRELKVPAAVGFFKPLIILPAWTLDDLSAVELRPILLHELAHVKRWDDWSNLLQKILQAALFFHPAVWFIEKRISLEREMACDEMVLQHTENPRAYAESLLSVAEKSFGKRGLSLAQAAVSRMRQTSARIAQILDTKRKGTRNTWKPVSLMLTASALMTFILLPNMPQLVAFEAPKRIARTNIADVISIRVPENSISASAAVATFPRKIHPASLRQSSRREFRPGRIMAESTPAQNLIEAKLTQVAPDASEVPGNGEFTMARETLVVMRANAELGPPEVVTIRVWQLTVFRCSRPVATAFPEKKI